MLKLFDSSKFKALNNRDKNFTKGKVKRRLQQIDKSIARYLMQMESLDRQESALAEDKSQRLSEKIEISKGEIEKPKTHEAAMLAAADEQLSLTDPDARSMATSGRGSGLVGYNVQAAGLSIRLARSKTGRSLGNSPFRLVLRDVNGRLRSSNR